MSGPAVDAEGYLVNPGDWNEDWARQAAEGEKIDLTQEHWTALRFMRAYLDEHHVPPDARFVIRCLTQSHASARNRLFELFPYGYVQQACKIAGMRRPRIWSTG
jgi:TusE/DsrC/DsvC family sulfur relay protein